MGDERQERLDAIRARSEKAHEEVRRMCRASSRWLMSIPAQPKYDSDLVISAALNDLDALLTELEHLQLHVTACTCAARCRETGCEQLSLEVGGDG
jgi:hypothetical protein